MIFVVFEIDSKSYALRLGYVETVALAVEVTPLADAAGAVLGVVNVHGSAVPAVAMRRVLGLPEREVAPGDRLMVVRAGGRRAALVVDGVSGVVECPEDKVMRVPEIRHPLEEGVFEQDGGMVVVIDGEALLSRLDEGWRAAA